MREGLLIAIYLLDRFPRRPPPQAIGAPGPRPRRPPCLCLCLPPLQVRIVLAPLETSLEVVTQFFEDVRSRGGTATASTCIRDGLDRPQYGNIARLWRCRCCMTASHRMHCLEHDLARWRPLSACACSLSLMQNSCGGPATVLPRGSRRAVAYSTDQGRKQGANVVIRTPRARNPAPRGHSTARAFQLRLFLTVTPSTASPARSASLCSSCSCSPPRAGQSRPCRSRAAPVSASAPSLLATRPCAPRPDASARAPCPLRRPRPPPHATPSSTPTMSRA